MNFNKPKLITLLAIGLFVLGSGLNNAIAQTASTATLSFGTRAGLTLNLILPTTVNGKVYYFLDNDGDGSASTADRFSHQDLNNLLNNGERTIITQEGNHNGSDDARSVIIRNYALILPTEREYGSINSQYFGITSHSAPPGWALAVFGTSGNLQRYAAASDPDPDFLAGPGFYFGFNFRHDQSLGSSRHYLPDEMTVVTAFQVIEVLKFRTKVFLEGAQ